MTGRDFRVSSKLKKFLKIPLILLCLTVPLAAWIWCGEGGMVRLCRTEVERKACLDRIRKLVAENQALFDEVHRFRTDMTYVETVARTELNLIRENEVIYRFEKGGSR